MRFVGGAEWLDRKVLVMFLSKFFKKKKADDLPEELKNISDLLEYIKKYKRLPINLSREVLNALVVIAETPDWDKQLDEETITNLNKVYTKWQQHINTKQNKSAVKVAKAEGFERPKYWEGTWAEYEKACENNEIDENTKVEIIEDDKNYHGSWLSIDENGEIEEYMD